MQSIPFMCVQALLYSSCSVICNRHGKAASGEELQIPAYLPAALAMEILPSFVDLWRAGVWFRTNVGVMNGSGQGFSYSGYYNWAVFTVYIPAMNIQSSLEMAAGELKEICLIAICL